MPSSRHSAGLPISRNVIICDCYSYLYNVSTRILRVLLEAMQYVYNMAQNILRGTAGTEERNSGTYGLIKWHHCQCSWYYGASYTQHGIGTTGTSHLQTNSHLSHRVWQILKPCKCWRAGTPMPSGLLFTKLEKVRQRYELWLFINFASVYCYPIYRIFFVIWDAFNIDNLQNKKWQKYPTA